MQFGNFHGVVAYDPKKLLVFDENKREYKYLAIEGGFVECCDEKVIDTPRIPTVWWLNWAINRANSLFVGNGKRWGNPNGNTFIISFKIKPETAIPTFVFSSNIHPNEYEYPIMDFILQYTYAQGQSMLLTQIESFFTSQQPT